MSERSLPERSSLRFCVASHPVIEYDSCYILSLLLAKNWP
jgi:hypothetical protein